MNWLMLALALYLPAYTIFFCPLEGGGAANPRRLCLTANPALITDIHHWTFLASYEQPWSLSRFSTGLLALQWHRRDWNGKAGIQLQNWDSILQTCQMTLNLATQLHSNIYGGLGADWFTKLYNGPRAQHTLKLRMGWTRNLAKGLWAGQYVVLQNPCPRNENSCWIVKNGLHWKMIPAVYGSDFDFFLTDKKGVEVLLGQSFSVGKYWSLRFTMGTPPLRYAVTLSWKGNNSGWTFNREQWGNLPVSPGVAVYHQTKDFP